MSDYRIVRDGFSGYEVQVKSWWWPFWRQLGINTHMSVFDAEQYALRHSMSGEVVRYLGRADADA